MPRHSDARPQGTVVEIEVDAPSARQLEVHPEGSMMVAFEFSPGEDAMPRLVLPEPTAHQTAQLVNLQLPASKPTMHSTPPRRPDPRAPPPAP